MRSDAIAGGAEYDATVDALRGTLGAPRRLRSPRLAACGRQLSSTLGLERARRGRVLNETKKKFCPKPPKKRSNSSETGPSHQCRRGRSSEARRVSIAPALTSAPAARTAASAMPAASKPCFLTHDVPRGARTSVPTCTQCTRNALAALLPQALRVSAMPAAERRLMVTPIGCQKRQKCSILACLTSSQVDIIDFFT